MIARWFRRLRCPHPPAAEKNWGYTKYGGPKRLVECRACGKRRVRRRGY
jgi:hypothetical protein